MADIFDLAQKINAQRRQAAQGYSSPLEDLPLQIGLIFAQRDKEKRISLKNDSKFLSNMIANAKTPEQLDNLTALTNTHIKETFRDPKTRLYGEALRMEIGDKNNAHKNYIAAMEWADSMANKEVEYDDGTESGIKRKNTLELSEDDLTSLTGDDFKNLFETYQGYEDAIAQGQAHEFKYTRGKSSNKTLTTQLGKYRDTLDSAIQAHLSGKVITDNEAVCIVMGKYNECKKEDVGDISKDISFYRSSMSKAQKAIDSLRKSGLDKQIFAGSDLSDFVDTNFLEEAGVDQRDSVEKIIKDLEARKKSYQTDYLDPLLKRKYFWTGMKEGVQIEANIFVDDDDKDVDNGDKDVDNGDKDKKFPIFKEVEGFNPKTASAEEIKVVQEQLGVTPDGVWGDESQKAFDEVNKSIAIVKEVKNETEGLIKSVFETFTDRKTQVDIYQKYGKKGYNLFNKLYRAKMKKGEDSKQYKNLYKRLEKYIAETSK